MCCTSRGWSCFDKNLKQMLAEDKAERTKSHLLPRPIKNPLSLLYRSCLCARPPFHPRFLRRGHCSLNPLAGEFLWALIIQIRDTPHYMEGSTLSSDVVVCFGFVHLPWHFILTCSSPASLTRSLVAHLPSPSPPCFNAHEGNHVCITKNPAVLLHQGAGSYSVLSVAVESLKKH